MLDATAALKAATRNGRSSPARSNSAGSGLFDALVMAATGGAVGGVGMGPAAPGEVPVSSAYPFMNKAETFNMAPAPIMGGSRMGAGGSGFLPVRPTPLFAQPGATAPGVQRLHHPPQKNRSRLWSALSSGELDSLQVCHGVCAGEGGVLIRGPAEEGEECDLQVSLQSGF